MKQALLGSCNPYVPFFFSAYNSKYASAAVSSREQQGSLSLSSVTPMNSQVSSIPDEPLGLTD